MGICHGRGLVAPTDTAKEPHKRHTTASISSLPCLSLNQSYLLSNLTFRKWWGRAGKIEARELTLRLSVIFLCQKVFQIFWFDFCRPEIFVCKYFNNSIHRDLLVHVSLTVFLR